MERKDSFDSIPDVDFVVQALEDLDVIDLQINSPSEFKIKEKNGLLLPEPLLQEDKSRFVLFPIKHNDVRDDFALHNFSFTKINV